MTFDSGNVAESPSAPNHSDSGLPEASNSSNSGKSNPGDGQATTAQTGAARPYHFDATTVFVSKDAEKETPVPDFEVRGTYAASSTKTKEQARDTSGSCSFAGETFGVVCILRGIIQIIAEQFSINVFAHESSWAQKELKRGSV